MNVFVTGGTGFIGSHLVDQLINHPDYNKIDCEVRNQEKWIEGKDFVKVSGDLHWILPIADALANTDIVSHLAAIVYAPTEKEFIHANVGATKKRIRLEKKNGDKHISYLT